MRIELTTEPGTPDRPNEDWVSVAAPATGHGGSLIVLDGVTPPPGDDGCRHSVPWFTAHLGGALAELSVSRRDMSLLDTLGEAIARTADAHRDTCDLSHPRTPQATVVVARWDDERVEHLVLSDSALLVEAPDGAVTAHLDDRLDRVPRAHLVSNEVADATVRNKEGGFFTAAADPSVARRAVTGTLPRAEVRALAAMTDGVTRWVETFHEGGWADLFALVRKEGVEAVVSRVRALEDADEASRTYLRRGKVHDDATLAYVAL
ncbi:protein phosphatase 2C domain-containing protein [Streptomyces sp. WG-D5]